MMKISVLISNPSYSNNQYYLPYNWAVLKTYADQDAVLQESVNWLTPIYLRAEASKLLEPYMNDLPDVLGLSCYIWNWELQCELAEIVKSLKPTCLVVAGGPHPAKDDPLFFKEHPYIDLIVRQDGEITFSKMLKQLLEGDHDFRKIPGLFLPHETSLVPYSTGKPEVPTEFPFSPYLKEKKFFEKIIREHDEIKKNNPSIISYGIIWETNRGCPYGCSFCDWGSSTLSKLRRIEMDRLKEEIAWFGEIGASFILNIDANFGILDRDIALTHELIKCKQKWNVPNLFIYSAAKNNPKNTVEISKLLVKNGLAESHLISIQHTDPEVLKATDRENISIEKQKIIAAEMFEAGIPTMVQLILGIPGDTYEKWKNCLATLMSWGLHDNLLVFNYALVPNAPAADKLFLEYWEIETINRLHPNDNGGIGELEETDFIPRIKIIVGSKTFSKEDWVKMSVYTDFVRALHNHGLTRYIAMYFYFSYGIDYNTFYSLVIEDFFGNSSPYKFLTNHYQNYLDDENAILGIPLEEYPDWKVALKTNFWLFVQICIHFDQYYHNLGKFLLNRFPEVKNLQSLLEYQKNVLVLPNFEVSPINSFTIKHDWITYFHEAQKNRNSHFMDGPDPVKNVKVIIKDDLRDLKKDFRSKEERLVNWMMFSKQQNQTVDTLLKNLEIQPSKAFSLESILQYFK